MNKLSSPKFIYLSLFLIVASTLAIQIARPSERSLDLRSKAAGGNTITVCPEGSGSCQYAGGDGIQQAVDNAQNGDTIIISPGRYTRRNPTDDEQIKYRFCMVNTRGKTLTIKGGGAILDGENGGINSGVSEDKATWAIGICDQGGNITIDSLQIKQTLRPAIFLRNSTAVIKNVTFLDIDNTAVDVWPGSKVIILNSLFAGSAGPGIYVLPLPGDAYARIENNTFYGNGGAGIIFNLCSSGQPKGSVSNNLIVNPGDLSSKPLSGSGIGAECRDQELKVADIKTANNFAWKGQSNDGCLGGPDKKSPYYADCVPGEICSGTTVTYPYFVGADEQGTVCVYGEGTTAGDFNTRSESPVTKAGAGYGNGPCGNGGSTGCLNYIEQLKQQLIPPVSPTPAVPTDVYPSTVQPTTDNLQPTSSYPSPTSGSPQPTSDYQPPITYYLPPTIIFGQATATPDGPTQINPQPTNEIAFPSQNPLQPTVTTSPTITPTPVPIIDIRKTLDNAKNTWNSFIISLIRFTQTVMP